MLKEIKYLIFIVIITLFIFFTGKYYFSDENIKKSYRSYKNINEKITQAKNNAIKEVKKISTIIAIESAKKIISQTLEKNKVEDINHTSVQESIASLKKSI